MSIGPFSSYAPPGVYLRTTAEPAVGQLLGGLRVPVLIGPGKEALSQTDYEIIRGSSSVADTPIYGEDAAGRWMIAGTNNNPVLGPQDGTLVKFRVRNYPIVDGTGAGRVTFDPSKVSVLVNGQQVVAAQLDGTNGIVSLLLPPLSTDNVSISYYFHRKDTLVTDDVSDQVTDGSAILIAPQAEPYDIASGSNTLYLILDDVTPVSVSLAVGSRFAAEIANDITAAAVAGLSASVHIDAQGYNHVQLVAQGNVRITTDSPNAAQALGFNPNDYTGRNTVFRVFNGPIVDGLDGGITTTDTSKVTVMVDGVQVIASAVDGANRLVTLPFAPKAGAAVTIRYYFNTFQDTFDYLPNSNITSVGNVGVGPGRRDYINGTDFIVINNRDQSIMQWGTAFQVVAGQKTGSISFDSTQIVGLLVDNRIYGAECTRYTDPVTNVVSTTKFVLPLTPTTGNGRDTPLGQSLYQTITNGRIDLPTNRPDLVTVYAGKTFRDAFSRPAVKVLAVDSATGTVTLKDQVPADYKTYASFWYNTIVDEEYTLKCVASGPSGIGKFTVTANSNSQPMFQVRFGSKTSLPQTIQWPSGSERLPDAIHYGGAPVAETVTVTFDSSIMPATHASFSNGFPGPYDIYTYSRMFGNVVVDGTSASINLSTAFAAQLLSDPISDPTALSFLTTDYVAFRIDGVDIAPVALTGLTTIANVVTAINAAIDSDVQAHSDGSDPFAQLSIDTVVTLANDLRTTFLAHRANTGGGFHTPADTRVGSNVTSPAATSLATAITLLNEISTSYTNHLTYVPEHGTADANPAHAIVAPAATDLASAILLANDIKAKYNLHIPDVTGVPPIHALADTFNGSTAPNASIVALNLASSVTYGTQSLLLVKGRNVKTQTNGLSSNVTVLTPTGTGQTDASLKLGLMPGKSADGSWSALNQPATMVGTAAEPFSITAGVNDTFLFGIDGITYTSTIPSGTLVTLDSVVNYINSWYAGSAPAADQAIFLADAVALLNDIQTKYNTHQASAVYHTAGDTHASVAPVATNLATAITLANEIKTQYNLHRVTVGGGPVHGSADNVNAVSAPDASNLRTLLILAYELKVKLNAHLAVTAGPIPAIHLVVDVADVVTLGITEIVAQTGQGLNAGKLTLYSKVNDVTSSVTIGTGSANTKLGFTNNSSAVRHQPTAADIAGALNANGTFIGLAAAWPDPVAGLGTYLRIDSLTTGLTSTISFSAAANTAFVTDTGLGIVPGTSGDSGESAKSGFRVTSSAGASGSSGTGVPGQTYTDAVTGLRFTILPLSVGDYASGGSFTLVIDPTFICNANLPWKAIPGVETTVFNTTNVGMDSTAILSTYGRSGTEPQIGDVYYVSYEYAKTDLTTGLYRDSKKIIANFGSPTPAYPISLGARLAMMNGTVLIGLRQVLRAENSSQASVASYAEAIDEQRKPITGNVKPDVITPLATDPQIFAYLNQHCVFMSAPRQEGERTGVVGPAAGTSSLGVQSIAKALSSEMMVVSYPDIYVLTITDDQGNTVDQVVDGSYMAAALAGASCNPQFDVATPWTRRTIAGFKRVGRLLDPTEANQVAVAGVTVMEQLDTVIRVRHGLTTRMDTVITRTPSVTLIIQYVQQSMRENLDPYIGQKFTNSLLKSAEGVIVGLFSNLISQEIVSSVAGISTSVDENDPTIMRAEAIYVPVFPLEYILANLSIRIRA